MAKRNDGGERLREEDLLISVLSRLDVKTLLQCKAVSKTWYSLISTPIFIKSHLNRALTTTTLLVRLFKYKPDSDSPEEDGSFSLYELGGCDDFVKHLEFPYSKRDYPFRPSSLLIGCVCGIVCVCVDLSVAIKVYSRGLTVKTPTDIYIWNPATKQSKLVPLPNTRYDCNDNVKVALGFGFDPVDVDFKVVRVLSTAIFPEVYSVNRNVWRKIETKLSDIPCRKNNFGICLHGYLFAIGRNGLMAFDLNKEVFTCDIQLPVCTIIACIAEFKDSIAVIISNFNEEGRINLWTLDDEACLCGTGVKASWTMMLTVDVGVECHWVYGIFNSAELLLAVLGDWFSYNLDKKVGRYINCNPIFYFDKFLEYTESLLPVAGSKLVNWSADKGDNEESSTDSEEVSEKSNVDSEDNNEESSISVGSEDDNEVGATDSEDSEESSGDSEDDAGGE
ncbi:F-box domain-containing protein [Heracleum sosnowskyi]|uniref:F-box domain-containing protein n=1 Tax=Heracleum sosnowskyi TaxID=360622 RepID=A0AAD8IJK2_9APIA|nr:F-box domain-containing protein [Heracleum sosnowskyi]